MPRFIYTALLYLALPFVPLKLLWRGIKQPAYRQHWQERFGFYSQPVSKPIIWLHCVSVGETRAAAPLIHQLKATYPNHQILHTHTTPTGRETSELLFGINTVFGDGVTRVYLPYDVPFAVKRFLTHFKPSIGLLMETELWFNLIAACKHQNLPLLLLNARLSEKSATGYRKLGQLASNGIATLDAIAAQTQADATRFETLGANNVLVTGNLKFDVKPPHNSLKQGLQLRKLMGEGRTIFLAASTREGEEALILDAVKDLNILTVIVPRHPQRFNEVAALLQAKNINYVRRTTLKTAITKDVNVILGDSMGELFSYYAACDFTFVGGSLLNFGGQNLIEPASMGKPIIIGKHTFNFAAASNNAVEAGAAIQVDDVAALRQQIQDLQSNIEQRKSMQKAALTFSQSYTGAAQNMMKVIARYLPSAK